MQSRQEVRKPRWREIAGPPRVVMGARWVEDLPEETPIIVTDIDRTISPTSSLGFMVRTNASIVPYRDAVQVLTSLSQRYQVVYLTARSWWQIPKTIDWLSRHEFPVGPLIHLSFLAFLTTARFFKIDAMARLKKRFHHIRWGVGDKLTDMIAYARSHVRPILITTRKMEGTLRVGWMIGDNIAVEGHVVTSWREIDGIISADR